MTLKTLFVMAVGSIGVLTGCATPTPVAGTPDYSNSPIKLSVFEEGSGQEAKHVFCEDSKCPKRTQKFIAVPPPPVKKDSPSVDVQQALSETFTVHFRWAWARLDEAGQKELQTVLARLEGKQITSIDVSGRTDPTGGGLYNKKLALRRAQTVKESLIHAGVSASIIKTSAKKPCCDGDLKASPVVMQQLRRTDIEITITTK